MKKFISMVMATAMVVSLVPATAFAGDTGSAKAVAKVINSADIKENADKAKALKGTDVELQLKVDGDGQYASTSAAKHELTFTLDGAEFHYEANATQAEKNAAVKKFVDTVKTSDTNKAELDNNKIAITEADKDTFKMTINTKLFDKDLIKLKLGMKDNNILEMKNTSAGKKATISVEGDLVNAEGLVFAEVKGKGIKATVKKVAEVAQEESTKLERDLKIEANVGDFAAEQVFELRLGGGFEFGKIKTPAGADAWRLVQWNNDTKKYVDLDADTLRTEYKGETKAYIRINKMAKDFTVAAEALEIIADSAKVGAECKLTVKAVKVEAGDQTFSATADAVVIAKVVDNIVTLEVDKDADVPEIYSGVTVNNFGITDDSDHKSLEISIKEASKGALDVKKSFTLALPEGVYATDVDVTDTKGTYIVSGGSTTAKDTEVEKLFAEAYKKGDQDNFEFARRVFTDTDSEATREKMALKFKMTLVAEPGFTGDVKLTLNGDGFDKAQTVTIAKFKAPYTVEAQQNDLIIDYRNTKVPTDVKVKEAEAGLWKKDDMAFEFTMDKPDVIQLEDDATIKVNDASGMKLKDTKDMKFKVKDESSDEAAVVTLSNIALYMGRDVAAGAYDLKLTTTAGTEMMTKARLFTAKEGETGKAALLENTGLSATKPYYAADYRDWDVKGDAFVAKSFKAQTAFVNVVTAGRDQDNTFTTKVLIPIDGDTFTVGGKEVKLADLTPNGPAVRPYNSTKGRAMLPLRAVAVAVGLQQEQIVWDNATKTVTILHGQKIITMTVGKSTMYINGNAVPMNEAVAQKEGRVFLPFRDLATALGITDIDYDTASRTVIVNGKQTTAEPTTTTTTTPAKQETEKKDTAKQETKTEDTAKQETKTQDTKTQDTITQGPEK